MQTTNLRGSRLRLRSRPLCTTVFLLSLLTAGSFLAQTRHAGHGDAGSLHKRGSGKPSECGEVHSVSDQCDFVKQHCVGDNAGLLPYLEFYYCTLRHARPAAFVLLVAWLGLLFTTIGIAASDFFSVNLSTIAAILGLSESLAGVTFLAFGNGSPDVFSTFAAMGSNSPSMAVGELLGAASFITGVVAGSMALTREFKVDKKTYVRDICFFIVAVAFTMAFLADGQLRFWECWAMVGYYILYVITVVGWHWAATRRRRRLRREGEARSHFFGMPGGPSGDELAGEPYRDDPDDVDRGPRQPPQSDALSFDRAPRLEVDGQVPPAAADDADGRHERMVAAEVTRNMRLVRTGAKRHHHNMNPIRPSLVGALEFRSALAQLQRESNLQLSPILTWSLSETHVCGVTGRRGTMSGIPDSNHHDSGVLASNSDAATTRRERALSSGDAPISSAILPAVLDNGQGMPNSDVLVADGLESGQGTPTPSYTIAGNLAPPPSGPSAVTVDSSADAGQGQGQGQGQGPCQGLQLLIQPSRRSSHSERWPACTPFPGYSESPMALSPKARSHQAPPTLAGPTSARRDDYFSRLQAAVQASRPVRWWPHSLLPPPHVLLATLFPTLQGWREKSHWDRFLSAISVPSIFLLVITLPVVESEANDEDTSCTDDTMVDGPSERHAVSRGQSPANGLPEAASPESGGTAVEPAALVGSGQTLGVAAKPASDLPSVSNSNNEVPPWNRWLVCLQLVMGPLFAVFILWANLADDWEQPGLVLVRMVLYTLVGSLVVLALLLLTTTEHARPRFHYLLCFLGFISSIAWISTIAGEVVGVLKAFGIILGISEALLGLTIFAAGNSIGDLVADITVARLGYPVMALSACFGGPMLNILLGIGIGGVMMMVRHAKRQHAKHPDEPVQYGPYRVQVSKTLLISSITLLTMLVLLLVVVPMNKWILSRKIGWGLMALWTMSTVVNVVVELTGAWGDAA